MFSINKARYKSKFDFFFHMAGNTIFSDNTEEKKSAMSSVKIIKNSIKLADICCVENFIFISSGAVYGKNSKRKLVDRKNIRCILRL